MGDKREHEVVPMSRWQLFVLRCTNLLTLTIKAVGIAIAANEAFLTEPQVRDPLAFGIAAFMMAGAQGFDNIVGNLLGGGKK